MDAVGCFNLPGNYHAAQVADSHSLICILNSAATLLTRVPAIQDQSIISCFSCQIDTRW
jgi:hypothetical protein